MTSIESKRSIDLTTLLHRFVCACGRRGCWLERREVVEANAQAHQHSEHGSQERYS